ncbi:MAG: putative bifunctional diguanylate cyclase/phosphodiesterase [Mobilitalea sp.]
MEKSSLVNKINKTLQTKNILYQHEAIYIAIIYAIFGVSWILLSDKLLEYIFRDIDTYKLFQTYKGWFFILITTLMLYLLIKQRIRLMQVEFHKTAKAYGELREAHEDLRTMQAELTYQTSITESIIDEAPVIIATWDEQRTFISLNPFGQKLLGYTEDEIMGEAWKLIIPEGRDQLTQAIFERIHKEKQFINFEGPIKTKDGRCIDILWSSKLLSPRVNGIQNTYVSIGTDIEERKLYEKKIEHLAFYDTLTGLPNRTLFEIEINKNLNNNLIDNNFMIAYIDIDNFKNINDSMGHQVGDLFLTYFGECLNAEVIEPDIVARLGGDEFAILYLKITKQEILTRIETIMQRIRKTWLIENHQFYISMSIGVVTYPSDGITSTILLKNADIAMYSAKREGKNRVLFYKEDISENNTKNLEMINNLQYAIDEEQFLLYYQPQFKLNTGEINGMEALVRWVHPKKGFIPPGEFIPIAEESGQIYKLERWIVAKALEEKKIWEELGHEDLVMSINLSGKTLTSRINFDELEQILDNASVNFEKIVIEITETASISDVETVIKHLHRLKRRGIRIALDDFGTGYSSLNYLKKFPINIIKLDRSFIDAINDNGIDMLLIKNILTLAHDLEFEVIAEGIETKEQLEFLRNHLCESGQGYLLSRPQPEDKIHSLLNDKFRFLD